MIRLRLTRRRWLAVGAILAISIGTTACSSASSTSSSTGTSSGKLKSILFVNPLPNYPGWHLGDVCMAAEAKKLGIPYSSTGPTGGSIDTPYMLARIQQGIADKVGAIITFPVSGPEFQPVLEQARKAGILVATLYGGGSTTAQNFDAGVSYEQAAAAGAAAVAARPGKQYVGIIVATPTPPSTTWSDGFETAAKNYPNVTVVTVQYDQGNATNDVDIAAEMLIAHPNINIIATNEGAATPGVTSAIREAKKVGKVFLLANNAANGGIAAVQNGTAYATMLADGCGGVKKVIDDLEALHDGQTVPSEIDIPLKFVTKSDYEPYVQQGWA
jgi:ABC-type sugar transport system substrate-binding protein